MNDELERLQCGGEKALAELFSEYRDRLERLVDFRLDHRLSSRVDPSDVLQEAYIEIARRYREYLNAPNVSFYVWVRQLTLQALIDIQRRHFGLKRTPQQEVNLKRGPSESTSDSIAQILGAQLTSPSGAAIRAEEIRQLHLALASMDEIDREVLALRHFEHLGNGEVAETLGLTATAASNRYIRAMTRLSEIMQRFTPGST
ncbi:sigma-70 family RNA polymerase sigma factor [Schlesneria paludicola]|uniref:sigma-70 family RNA polymerase sigma factor n=1 Tax=Schlesneria paludicola TaxID=360056 RepID=UPI000299E327|nr:sigma-70 family RNA polymerase sigma factor [Schlesneria paludicola]